MRAFSSPTNLRTKIEDLNRGRIDHQRFQWLVKRLSGQSFVTSVRSFRQVFFSLSVLAFYPKMLFTYQVRFHILNWIDTKEYTVQLLYCKFDQLEQ